MLGRAAHRAGADRAAKDERARVDADDAATVRAAAYPPVAARRRRAYLLEGAFRIFADAQPRAYGRAFGYLRRAELQQHERARRVVLVGRRRVHVEVAEGVEERPRRERRFAGDGQLRPAKLGRRLHVALARIDRDHRRAVLREVAADAESLVGMRVVSAHDPLRGPVQRDVTEDVVEIGPLVGVAVGITTEIRVRAIGWVVREDDALVIGVGMPALRNRRGAVQRHGMGEDFVPADDAPVGRDDDVVRHRRHSCRIPVRRLVPRALVLADISLRDRLGKRVHGLKRQRSRGGKGQRLLAEVRADKLHIAVPAVELAAVTGGLLDSHLATLVGPERRRHRTADRIGRDAILLLPHPDDLH